MVAKTKVHGAGMLPITICFSRLLRDISLFPTAMKSLYLIENIMDISLLETRLEFTFRNM